MKNKGFTIIELLVVIAIIGLISSVVLVSMKGSTGKARIAKGLEFSQTIMNAIGVDAVGIWSFDEGSGPTAFDKSGYGNHGTITGATFVDGEENTPHWYVNEGEGRSALEFNGTSQWVSCGNNSSLNPINAVTIEAWVYPNELGRAQFIIGRGCTGNRKDYYMMLNGNTFYMVSADGSSRDSISSDSITATQRWYHVVGTWNTTETKIVVNGKEYSSSSSNSAIVYSGTGVYIGRYGCGTTTYFNGLIDEVRIYERALSSAEIQQHYVDGIDRHQLAIND